MTQFCQNCGAPLKDNARFCPSCGHQMGQSAQSSTQYTNNQNQYSQKQYNAGGYAQQQQPYAYQQPQQGYAYGGQPPYQPPYQQPQKKKGGCCLVALIVVLAILAALGIGGYFVYKYAKDKFEDAKDMIEESFGLPLSSIIDFDNPEQLEKLEEMGVTSEEIDKIKEMAGQNDKPDKTKKGKGGKKIAVKDEDFFGVTLPFPDMGEITTNFSDWSGSIETKIFYIDKISYKQFIEYCKMLEALPGWEAHEEDNVANFPKDYNKKMMTMCVGDYNGLHVVVTYICDSFIKGTDKPHFTLQVKNKG